MKTIKLTPEQALEIYHITKDGELKNSIENKFRKEIFNQIHYKVKTFEDVCEISKLDPNDYYPLETDDIIITFEKLGILFEFVYSVVTKEYKFSEGERFYPYCRSEVWIKQPIRFDLKLKEWCYDVSIVHLINSNYTFNTQNLIWKFKTLDIADCVYNIIIDVYNKYFNEETIKNKWSLQYEIKNHSL